MTWEAMLRLHLLGSLRLFEDTRPLKFSAPPKTLPLLAYLLLHSDLPVKRETLAFTLWPDETEANARANVRRHLHHLGRALPPTCNGTPWLLLDTETARWNPEADCWLDVVEFKHRSARPESLAEAVGLYKGDLLEDVYDDWLFYPREELRTLYLSNLNQLILRCRGELDNVRALEYASRLLTEDPLREDAIRQLMALRYEIGDRAGALSEYEQFARRLRRELAVDPMPETVALYENIVRKVRLPAEVPAALVPDVTHPATPARMAMPFVGRQVELEQLRAAWSRAARHHGGMVLVGGEAGIGKTRLASELALIVEGLGGRVLWGAATAESMAYQAIIEALRSALPLIAALEIEPLWLAAVASLVPDLRARKPNLPPLSGLDPERERVRLFESLARAVEGLAQPRPLLLLLEDLQWAGLATLEWLEFLAGRLAHLPVLVMGTYREEEAVGEHPLHTMRRRLQRANLVSHVALGRLDAPSVRKIAQGLAPELEERLYTASEGHPLFIHEMIRDWIEAGKAVPAVSAPASLEAMLAARLARLSATAINVCQVAAVAGASFDVDLVREVAGWSEAQTLDAFDELLDHQLIREAAGRSRFDYAFTHHMIQSAVYNTIPEDGRVRRHRRVAHVIEQLSPTRGDDLAGALARHWDRGGEPVRAAQYYLRAAQHARTVYADMEALAFVQRGLELTSAPQQRIDFLGLRESIYGRRGDREAQHRDLLALHQIAESLGDVDRICDSLQREIHYQRMLGNRQAEAALIQSLSTRSEEADQARWVVEALREQATYQISISQYESAGPMVDRALEIYEAHGDAVGLVQCLCLRGEIGIWQGGFDLVQASLERARALSQAQTNQTLLAQTLRAASAAAFTKQDFGLAQDLGQQMLELCRRIGDLEGEADALTRLGTVDTRLFRVQSARERYRQAADLYSRLGKRQGQAAVLLNSGLLAANRLGRHAEGLVQFRQAETLFAEMKDTRGQLVSALNIGMTAFFLGDFAEAKAASQHGLELARQMASPVMEANALANLGAAERELGELTLAIEHMEAGLALRRGLGQPCDLGTDLCDLALAYLRAGKLEAARMSAEEMLTLLATARDSMLRAEYMLWVAAQISRALGERVRGRDLLAEAYQVLKEKAAALADDELRASFLQYPFNREIISAFEENRF